MSRDSDPRRSDGEADPGVDRRRLLRAVGAAGTAGMAGLAGCSGTDGSTTTTGGTETTGRGTTAPGERTVEGTYTAATGTDASSLNWLTVADATSGSYIGLTLDGAWTIKTGQEVFPLWADYSTDEGRVYEIELRDNLRWGAGYGDMTAEDWVYMITNVFQAEPNWSGYPAADDWFRTNPESGEREPIPVEKTGTRTFEIRLFEVDPSFPFKPVMWGQNAAPKGILEKYVPEKDAEGLKQDEELNKLAYTGNLGPYSYERWQQTSQYVVTRNDSYYLREAGDVPERFSNAPYFERKVTKVIGEESTRLGALEAGEVDTAGIPPNKAARFRDLPGVDVNVTPQPFVQVLVYNQRANGWRPFRRKAVRRALGHAVDKSTIAQSIFRGFAEVAQTMQPRFSKWFDDSKVEEFGVDGEYGKQATRSALRSALSDTDFGYDGGRLHAPSGEQVSLSLTYDPSESTEQTMAQLIKQEFERNAGIGVELKSVSSETFQAKYAVNSPPKGADVPWSAGKFNGGPRDVSTSERPWDMSINLSFNTYPYTPSSSKGFFRKKGPINYYGYYPGADIASYYERAATTVDESKRQELFGTAFGLISEEQPFGFLTMPSSITGYRDRVVGYTEAFENGWDSQTWYFK